MLEVAKCSNWTFRWRPYVYVLIKTCRLSYNGCKVRWRDDGGFYGQGTLGCSCVSQMHVGSSTRLKTVDHIVLLIRGCKLSTLQRVNLFWYVDINDNWNMLSAKILTPHLRHIVGLTRSPVVTSCNGSARLGVSSFPYVPFHCYLKYHLVMVPCIGLDQGVILLAMSQWATEAWHLAEYTT
jgi:hypothetical protein